MFRFLLELLAVVIAVMSFMVICYGSLIVIDRIVHACPDTGGVYVYCPDEVTQNAWTPN